MARTDYYDDPNAPEPNSVVPAAVACVTDDEGRLLLEHRVDNDRWALPGGTHEFGESIVQTVIREVREETGLDVEVTGLVGIYTDPKHVILYTSDGETRQEFSVLFTARALGGEPTPSDESREVLWISRDALAELQMDRSMRFRIPHWLDGHTGPYLG